MLHAHFPSLAELEQRSPSGRFHSFARNVSLALGGIRNVGTWGGGHPFDFQVRRVPPGAAICPFHAHLAQWELFLLRAGHGTVRVGLPGGGSEPHTVRAGQFFVHPPGEPHQLRNTGDTDLEVFIFADNPILDGFHYPDSNKWGLRSPNLSTFFRLNEVDYFDGEEPSAAPFAPPPAPAAPMPAVATPFHERLRQVDDLAWEPWESPKRKFRGTSKELSIALGAQRHAALGLGGHPFDLELGRLAPGERGCPFHAHAAQWELFIFLAGTATVRAGDERRELHAGEVVLHPPFEPHDLTNTGSEPLDYLLLADNPPVDYWHYPDSQKWGLRQPRQFFRPTAVDYFDGEE